MLKRELFWIGFLMTIMFSTFLGVAYGSGKPNIQKIKMICSIGFLIFSFIACWSVFSVMK